MYLTKKKTLKLCQKQWSLVSTGLSKSEALNEMGYDQHDYPTHLCFLCEFALTSPPSYECSDFCPLYAFWISQSDKDNSDYDKFDSPCENPGTAYTRWRVSESALERQKAALEIVKACQVELSQGENL